VKKILLDASVLDVLVRELIVLKFLQNRSEHVPKLFYVGILSEKKPYLLLVMERCKKMKKKVRLYFIDWARLRAPLLAQADRLGQSFLGCDPLLAVSQCLGRRVWVPIDLKNYTPFWSLLKRHAPKGTFRW
jgi:hypothetical protein